MRGSEFVRYLNDADHHFVWIAVFIQQTEFHHGVVAADVALHVDHLVVLEVFLQLFLKTVKRIGKIHFKRAGIVGGGLHDF